MAFTHFAKGSIERAIDNELNRLNKQAVKLAKNGLHHSDTYNKVIWSMIEITGSYGNLNEKVIDGNIVYQAKRSNAKLSEYAKKKSKKEMTHSLQKSKNITTWEQIKKTADEYFEEDKSKYKNASSTLENNPTAIINKYKRPSYDDVPDDELEEMQDESRHWENLAQHEIIHPEDENNPTGGYIIKETGEIVYSYEEALREVMRLGSGYYDLQEV